jgi:hypothetical protein
MKKETTERLKNIGIATHEGGFSSNGLETKSRKRAVCAIWHESEEPTREERIILKRIVKKLLDGFGPTEVEGFNAKAADTVTLKKEDGKWRFRRLTWKKRNSWSRIDGSLETIEAAIFKI